MYHWMDAYCNRLSARNAQFKVKQFSSKKYSSHRQVSQDSLIGNAYIRQLNSPSKTKFLNLVSFEVNKNRSCRKKECFYKGNK